MRDRREVDIERGLEELRSFLTTRIRVDGEAVVLSPWWVRGASGLVLAGNLESSGREIVLKCPLRLIRSSGAASADEERFSEERGLSLEAKWLEKLTDGSGIGSPVRFPRLLTRFPVDPLDGSDPVPVLVMERVGGLSVRRVLRSLRAGRRGFRWLGIESKDVDVLTSLVAEWIGRILVGLHAIWDAGGVYTDIAPDNFMVGEATGTVTFLDAGSIVPIEGQSPIPIRKRYMPKRFVEGNRYLTVISRATPKEPGELQCLLLGMVCKMFVSGLTNQAPHPHDDPSVARLSSWFPVDERLEEFLAFGLGQLPDTALAPTWREVPEDDSAFNGILGSILIERFGPVNSPPGLWRDADGGAVGWV